MTEPERLYPSTLGFGRRITRRYIAPAPEQGQPAPEGEPLVAMGFVRRPTTQVSELRPPSIASRVIERAVQPALPVATITATPTARSPENVVAPASETLSWPELSPRTIVEPVTPFVPAAPEPSPERAAPAGEATVRRGFTLDEVRRALQPPARRPPSPTTVQREERQPAQSDEGIRPPVQDVQGETAAARPRPVSRLVEQPHQSEPAAQHPQEPRESSPTLSPVSGNEPSAPTVAPQSAEPTVSRQERPAATITEAGPSMRRQVGPDVREDVSRAVAEAGANAVPTPVAAPGASGQLPEASGPPQTASVSTTAETAEIPTPEEPAEQPLTRPLEGPGSAPDAGSAGHSGQRAPRVDAPRAVVPPVALGTDRLAREPAVTERPPAVPRTARSQTGPPGRSNVQPPEETPIDLPRIAPASSEHVEPGTDVLRAPGEAPMETISDQETMLEGAPPEIRRTTTPGRSRTSVPHAAVPPTSPETSMTPDLPPASLDLAAAYRAQLARYAAESQASGDMSESGQGPELAAPAGERVSSRLPASTGTTQVEPSSEPTPAVPIPTRARPVPSSTTGTVRRETQSAGEEQWTDTEPQLPPATYDSARPLRRQAVRLDRAFDVSSAPPPPAVQPALPVRRTVTQGDSSRAESATEAAPAAASPTQAPAEGEPDIEELAERVFAKLRGRLRVERERLGGTRLR